MAEISPKLDSLTCDLIGEAMNVMETEGKLPVLLMTDGSDELYAFEDDDPDGCYRAACQQVQDLGAVCNLYAIVYEGVVQESESAPGEPAIIFEFAERGVGEAWSGFMYYRKAKDGSLEVSEPYPGGAEEPLFS